MKIQLAEISAIAKTAMMRHGLSNSEAQIVLDHLVEAELSGRQTHGFVRVQRVCQMLDKAPLGDITVVKETPVSCLLRGGNKPGFVVALKATEIAIDKAKTHHVGIAGGFDTDTIGVAGYYPRLAAQQGLVGILTCNSTAKIPPWGSIDAIMGTNPLAIAIPTRDTPIVLDFSCSKITFGEALLAIKQGTKLPEGVLINGAGKLSRDPNDVRAGALLPIGEHKGAGLALMLEILSGPMVNAKGGRNAVPGSWGFFILVFDPEIFVSRDEFYSRMDSMITEIKQSRLAAGFDEILLPGERSMRLRAENASKTILDIPAEVLKDIQDL